MPYQITYAIRPFATAPEYDTPVEMKMQVQSCFLTKSDSCIGACNAKVFMGRCDIQGRGSRFTELVLPNGKTIYIENENEDKLAKQK